MEAAWCEVSERMEQDAALFSAVRTWAAGAGIDARHIIVLAAGPNEAGEEFDIGTSTEFVSTDVALRMLSLATTQVIKRAIAESIRPVAEETERG